MGEIDEEEFAQQIAEALENGMDLDEVEVDEDSATIRVTTTDGERFKVRVRKIEE